MGARHVIAVERDQRALPALEEISRRYPGRLEIVCADAQHFDPRPLLGATRAKIVANLPYNIATALLIDWLSIEPWPPWYDMMVLMFQREVAERIVARENDEAYGRLGVLANWRAETKILFDISPAAFVPQPKVTSSVVRLVPASGPGSLRPPRAGAGGRGRLRSAAQDVAAKPEITGGRSGPAGRGRPGRRDPASRNHSGQRLCCHGSGIDPYTQHKLNSAGGNSMPLMRRQSLVKFDAPLCETVIETPKPEGRGSSGPDRALRTLPFRPSHPGRLCRSRRRQEARHHARHDIAVHARPRDRGHRRGSRPRRAEGPDRRKAGGIPVDRLRPMPRLSGGR